MCQTTGRSQYQSFLIEVEKYILNCTSCSQGRVCKSDTCSSWQQNCLQCLKGPEETRKSVREGNPSCSHSYAVPVFSYCSTLKRRFCTQAPVRPAAASATRKKDSSSSSEESDSEDEQPPKGPPSSESTRACLNTNMFEPLCLSALQSYG